MMSLLIIALCCSSGNNLMMTQTFYREKVQSEGDETGRILPLTSIGWRPARPCTSILELSEIKQTNQYSSCIYCILEKYFYKKYNFTAPHIFVLIITEIKFNFSLTNLRDISRVKTPKLIKNRMHSG